MRACEIWNGIFFTGLEEKVGGSFVRKGCVEFYRNFFCFFFVKLLGTGK